MKIKSVLVAFVAWIGLTVAASANIGVANSVTGVQGYDLVSYHTSQGPIRGNGHYVSVQDGVTYLFASKENMNTFDQNPRKFLPAYGGYCAFGVSVGKKFVGDPDVWKIVDGRLYLNLDKNIQKEWAKDIPGRIKLADKNWLQIKDKSPSEL